MARVESVAGAERILPVELLVLLVVAAGVPDTAGDVHLAAGEDRAPRRRRAVAHLDVQVARLEYRRVDIEFDEEAALGSVVGIDGEVGPQWLVQREEEATAAGNADRRAVAAMVAGGPGVELALATLRPEVEPHLVRLPFDFLGGSG